MTTIDAEVTINETGDAERSVRSLPGGVGARNTGQQIDSTNQKRGSGMAFYVQAYRLGLLSA